MSQVKSIKEDAAVNEAVSESLIDNFSSAVKEGDVLEICKISYLIEQLTTLGRPKLQNLVQNDEHFAIQVNKAKKLCAAWKSKVQAGDLIDVFSETENKWFETRVLSINHVEDTCRVHYNGWISKYDADLIISAKQFCPVHTFSTYKKKGTRSKDVVDNTAAESTTSLATATTVESSSLSADTGSAGGALERARRRSRAGDVASASDAASEAAVTEKPAKKPKVEKDLNDWICGICSLLEAKDGSDLVLCECKYPLLQHSSA